MILNDEQEKALRRWWREVGSNPSVHEYGGKGPPNNGASLELRDAIAPLMRPWRVVGDFGHQIVRDDATNRSVEIKTYSNDGPDYRDLARRICDLLNESEDKR